MSFSRWGIHAVVVATLITVLPISHADSALPRQNSTISEFQKQEAKSVSSGHETKEEEGTEFWPPVKGYRLKITDTLVAGFTALLFFATWLLWLATKRLVRGAAESSKRQLRAYMSVEPENVYNFREKKKRVGVSIILKNHGATPASEIVHEYTVAPIKWPLAEDFKFPVPDSQSDVNSTLFPDNLLPTRFFMDRELTDLEISDIENDKQRLFVWGISSYRDAFGELRTTQFRASCGGPDFAETTRNYLAGKVGADGKARPGWFWDWAPGHNKAT